MRLWSGIFAWLVWLPLAAHAHTEIFFPKVFSAAELPYSGFVLLNPDPVLATVYMKQMHQRP